MTGRAERARHPRRAIVGAVVCALLLAGSGTAFGVHRYKTELRNDCAAAISAADQAIDDYVDAVTATKPILESADATDGYKDSEGAAELIAAVSGAERQVRMDLTCTSRDQLDALRGATSDLNAAKDALDTDSLHLSVSISSYQNMQAADELQDEIKAAWTVYDDSAGQLPDDGVREDLKTKIEEATALYDAAPGIRDQGSADNDPAPIDESTQKMSAVKLELSGTRQDTATAAGIAASQKAAEQAAAEQQQEEENPSDEKAEGAGNSAGNDTGPKIPAPQRDTDDDDDDDDDDDSAYRRGRDSSQNGGYCQYWVPYPYFDWWGRWHPGYWSYRRC